MTKRSVWMVLQLLLFLAFNFLLFLTIIFLFKKDTVFDRVGSARPLYNGRESFEPALCRLNSMDKLEKFCDSLYEARKVSGKTASFEGEYPLLVDSIVRLRFYHGYSRYRFSENYMALLLEPFTGKQAASIVIPDDMLNYPYAACSQQAILMMELLQRKGFATRRVGFSDKKYGGHFCFEVFYQGGWHFFDPNQEPDPGVLNAYNRPGIAFLAANKDVLRAAYSHLEPAQVNGLFGNFNYGKTNSFEAPRARLYQQATKFLSYTGWFFTLLAFLLVKRKYRKLGLYTGTTHAEIRNYFPLSNCAEVTAESSALPPASVPSSSPG